VHNISGEGRLVIEFKVPAMVADGVVQFAAFVGADFPTNIQHFKTGPIKVAR
jgi:hypothetical protein